jgi:proton-dependent oligopeptide transporter, POT family
MDQAAPPQDSLADDGPQFLGHPRGLYVLFFAEMWERFCYYGMRALLAFYVVQQFHKPQSEASIGYGAFTALIYAAGIFGGHVADRLLGYRRSIMLGGIIMAAGEFLLMVPNEQVFLLGLATIVVGNGLFKPNISVVVGKLYKPDDARRDSGFTIFYMGINLGAFLAPIFCARISYWLSPTDQPDYRYGFMLAGIGMIAGLIVFGLGTPLLRGRAEPPPHRQGFRTVFSVAIGCLLAIYPVYALLSHNKVVGYSLVALAAAASLYLLYIGFKNDKIVRQRIFALLLLLACNVVFWASFEQAGNALNFFALNHIHHLSLGDWTMVPEEFQSVNALGIILLGPVFAALWVWLARRHANPSIPTKFGLGLVQVGLGFALLLWGIQTADDAGKIPWIWLVGLYLIHTTGELCVSPVGLSMVTKLAPAQMTGLVMGAWFLSIACANFAAGLFSRIAGQVEVGEETATGASSLGRYVDAFTPIVWMSISVGVALVIVSKFVNKLMHGVK